MLPLNDFYNMDCMDGMKDYPDGYFDLAVIDPPYGGGAWKDKKRGRFTGGGRFGKYDVAAQDGNGNTWDVAPNESYFTELFRVCKNYVIWGANYFQLPPTRCFLVWYKPSISDNFSMANVEIAYTSFDGNAKLFEKAPNGSLQEPRFHPTQKPVELYTWILARFAKKGDKILDTHVGSASSLIACHRAGLDYVGFEINKRYYEMATKRLDAEKAQVSMFGQNGLYSQGGNV